MLTLVIPLLLNPLSVAPSSPQDKVQTPQPGLEGSRNFLKLGPEEFDPCLPRSQEKLDFSPPENAVHFYTSGQFPQPGTPSPFFTQEKPVHVHSKMDYCPI